MPIRGISLGALKGQDMGCDSVQEPPIVSDDHSTSGELEQSIFQTGECLHVEVVRRLIQEQEVATLLERQGKVQTVPLTTGENTGFLLLVGTFETETGDVGTRGDFHVAHLETSSPSDTTSHRVLLESMPDRS